MKKKLILIIGVLLLFMGACDSKKTDGNREPTAKEAVSLNAEKNLKGTFSANGKTYSGKVSVQNFEATGQYSVLCEDDSDPNNYKLVQFVFNNEAAARAGGKMVAAYDQGKNQTATEISISFDTRYRSNEDSKGNVTISKSGSNNELAFDNVTLETMSKEKVVVSGKIPF